MVVLLKSKIISNGMDDIKWEKKGFVCGCIITWLRDDHMKIRTYLAGMLHWVCSGSGSSIWGAPCVTHLVLQAYCYWMWSSTTPNYF